MAVINRAAMLDEALEAAPHLLSVTAFRHLRADHDGVWNKLMEAATKSGMAAAFGLALDPTHPMADQWIETIKDNHRAMYWALRFGAWGDDRSKLPYWAQSVKCSGKI